MKSGLGDYYYYYYFVIIDIITIFGRSSEHMSHKKLIIDMKIFEQILLKLCKSRGTCFAHMHICG